MKRFHFLLIFLIALFQVGCANQKPLQQIKAKSSWQHQVNSNSKINSWKIRGKMSFKSPSQTGSAFLSWQQSSRYKINLQAPLSIGSVYIYGDNLGTVTLTASDGTVLTGSSPDNLVYQQLGWKLPVSGLWHWIKGLPDPNKNLDEIIIAKNNTASKIVQDGWEINYKRYQSINGNNLPSLFTLSREDLVLKVLIKQWSI